MNDTERLREIAGPIVEKSNDDAMIKSAAKLLKLASEIENQRAEARKLAVEEQKISFDLNESRQRLKSDDKKAYITLLAPVFTTVVLAATLILQTYQFKQSEKDKQAETRQQADAAEDVRWAEAVMILSQSEKLSPAGILLKSFVKSDRYGDQAYKTAFQILMKTDDPKNFASLFNSVFDPVDWKNLQRVVELNRTLWSILDPLFQKSYDPVKKVNDIDNKLALPERNRAHSLDAHLEFITTRLASVLKGVRPAGVTLDLRSTDLVNGDFQGADLSGANLEGATMSGLDVKEANLSGITEYKRSRFFSTAWWQASRISEGLLEYLLKAYPCESGTDASGHSFSPRDCADGIARLRKSASKP